MARPSASATRRASLSPTAARTAIPIRFRSASMTKPYSLDLRERVVASVSEGRSRRAVAAVFKLGVATVVRWSQRARATGSAAAKPMGGRKRYLLEGEREWLLGRLAEKPDLTLH